MFFVTDLKARAAFLDSIEDDPGERIAIMEFDGAGRVFSLCGMEFPCLTDSRFDTGRPWCLNVG